MVRKGGAVQYKFRFKSFTVQHWESRSPLYRNWLLRPEKLCIILVALNQMCQKPKKNAIGTPCPVKGYCYFSTPGKDQVPDTML